MRDLPQQYIGAREQLLKLAYAFAKLDESTRERFADPKSRYRCVIYTASSIYTAHTVTVSFGWSHGKVCI